MEYVRRRRMELAAQLLRESCLSVLDIALMCGYETHEGFTRAFKGLHGVSPRQYRSSNRKEHPTMASTTNSRALAGSVLQLCGRIRAAGEAAAQAYEATGYGSQDVYAQELLALQEKAWNAAGFLDTLPDDGFGAASRRIEMVKLFEDTAFQLHIIALSEKLYFARTTPENQAGLQAAHRAVQDLAADINAQTGGIIAQMNEVFALVYQDIRTEAMRSLQPAFADVREAQARIQRLRQDMLAAMQADTRQSLRVVYAETGCLEAALAHWDEAPGGLDAAVTQMEEICAILPDLGFQMNILAFETKLEITRVPGWEQASSLAGQAVQLAGTLHQTAEHCIAALQQAKALLDVIPVPGEAPAQPNAQKRLADAAFQMNILLYHLRAEGAKLEGFAPPQAVQDLAKIEETVQHAIELAQGAKDASAAIPLAAVLQQAVAALQQAADTMGDKGAVIVALAEEYGLLADAVRSMQE